MQWSNLAGKKIALGVCGGIAAYKVAGLAREMAVAGADVKVVMTPSATKFVGPITFSTLTGNPVRTELFPEAAPSEIVHTDLGRTSDVLVVAPATAKLIAKAARGISDDLMSAMLLSASCPVVIAPAMHSEMWLNPATQQNVALLKSRGVRFVGPDTGPLAGPDSGVGRLADITAILEATDGELRRRRRLGGARLVVTAAGTREAIDAVRFIANASSGQMGYEVAYEAMRRGAQVTLISGPTHLPPPAAADVVNVASAEEMLKAVADASVHADVLIMAAAVADWRPKTIMPGKIHKSAGPPILDLEPTVDILALVGERRSMGELGNLKVLVGFCAEADGLEDAAVAKLKAKSLDLVVANLVGTADSGPGSPTSRALIVDREGNVDSLGLVTKHEVAFALLEKVAERLSSGL
ncbi:MAG: bifunctional phosphopantothenoylcysteine decarboxylase/phosphopantothenate--cysteine ligase CoaBC [Actinomycetota bacterium]|nr:bifunctional phosphopantothenoylcysteine decarboxylase/phosphopantothenate--cysteine ligase CoaBC [Actinomycetota bacterium]